MSNERKTDVNGLLACPCCGTLGEVRMQTPPCDDGIVRFVFFRCFSCGIITSDYPAWEQIHARKAGGVAWAPIRDFWNEWAMDGSRALGTERTDADYRVPGAMPL